MYTITRNLRTLNRVGLFASRLTPPVAPIQGIAVQSNLVAREASSTHSTMTTAIAALGVTMGITAIDQYKKSMTLPPLVDIDAIHASFKAMSADLIARKRDGAAKEKLLDFSRALNESIHKGNLSDFKRNLHDVSLLSGGLSDNYLKLLVHHLSDTGKTSFLKYLNEQLEIEITDPLGKKLIAHPAGGLIEDLVGQQFALGPGKIKRDGARTYLGKSKCDDMVLAMDMVDKTFSLSGMDMDADFATIRADFKAKEAIKNKIAEKYESVVLLDWEKDEDLYDYGDALKAIADKKLGKSSSLYILAAGHFVYGTIEVINHGDNHYSVRILHMESLGSTEGYTNGFENIMDAVMQAFPENTKVEFYCPELRTQFSPVGCSVLVLNDFNKMMYYDWTVQIHQPQYHGVLPLEGAIWAYMKRQEPVSRLGTYCKMDDIRGSSDNYTEVSYRYFQIERMPLFHSRQKQSLTSSGNTLVTDVERAKQDKNYEGHSRVVFGQMGYQLEYQQSPKKRQLEASQGFSPFSDETVEQYMGRLLKPNKQGKLQNTVIEEIYTWTLPLLHYLVDKSEEEIKALPSQFTLDSFRAIKDVSAEQQTSSGCLSSRL